MKFRDLLPNDKRPNFQRFAQLTGPDSYDRGCLWPDCNGKAIKAHVVSRKWMEAIKPAARYGNCTLQRGITCQGM